LRYPIQKRILENRCKNAVRTAKKEEENEPYRNLDPMVKLAMNSLSPDSEAKAKCSISGKGDLEK
tara:strand:+ start:170 stop:364 length:195 start_codon:yes stop_codon:yes gene_type:complete